MRKGERRAGCKGGGRKEAFKKKVKEKGKTEVFPGSNKIISDEL